MSSTFKTCFTKIVDIQAHPNPVVERLQVATVYGFQVIIGKDSKQVGDFALYVPVDSVLPADLEALVFPEGSKIKLHNSRVRQIRIQKFPSQGMLIEVSTIRALLEKRGLKANMEFKLEHDYSEMLGITKYEPPVPEFQRLGANKQSRSKPLENSNFHKYNGIDNLKWYPDMFSSEEEVVIQEKLHGSNCRAGVVPNEANTILKKIKKFFRMLPEFEAVYGSNNVELTNRAGYKGFYGEDVYGSVLNKIEAFKKIMPGEQIFGELIGEGIQKNYHYGHKEKHFVLFDVKVLKEGKWTWLNPDEVEQYAKERGFDFVPVLYKGLYNKQVANELVSGDSVYCPKQKVREGIVIKSKNEYHNVLCASNKKVLKYISPEYLDKDQTDFH